MAATTTRTVADFILAQLVSEESTARVNAQQSQGGRMDLAPILRKCEALRLVVATHRRVSLDDVLHHARHAGGVPGRCAECHGGPSDDGHLFAQYPCPTLRAIASAWSDAIDYDPAWSV